VVGESWVRMAVMDEREEAMGKRRVKGKIKR